MWVWGGEVFSIGCAFSFNLSLYKVALSLFHISLAAVYIYLQQQISGFRAIALGVVRNTARLPYEITGSQGCHVYFLCDFCAISGGVKATARHARQLQGMQVFRQLKLEFGMHVFVL